MRWPSPLVLLTIAACGSETSPPASTPDAGQVDNSAAKDAPCPEASHVGGFTASLEAGFTAVQGQVSDGVTPFRISDVVAMAGPCQLLQPPTLFCDPPCTGSTTCDANMKCVPLPVNVSVGAVSVTGLAQPVTMTARAPVFFYTNLGKLDHPGFTEGSQVELQAAGEATVLPFALAARGVAPLVVTTASVPLARDQAMGLQWSAPAQRVADIKIELNIANHGGTPGRVECHVPDTGSFTVPVTLTNRLLDRGFSGFPSLTLTRQSVSSIETAVGCVQFAIESGVGLDVAIPGLVSCSSNADCTPPQTCQPDLTCG